MKVNLRNKRKFKKVLQLLFFKLNKNPLKSKQYLKSLRVNIYSFNINIINSLLGVNIYSINPSNLISLYKVIGVFRVRNKRRLMIQ